jgi:transposase
MFWTEPTYAANARALRWLKAPVSMPDGTLVRRERGTPQGSKLARIVYDGSHKIGEERARALIEAAEKSVGSSEPYRLRAKYLCEDLDVLRRRLKDLARDIERKLDDHEVGKLLTTIDGVGPLAAACLIAELGDPVRFRSAGAIASYVGVAPPLRQSGQKRFFSGSPTIPLGNARLRKALWMVVLNAVRCNPWLRQHYERLRAAGKPGKGRRHRGDAKAARSGVERRTHRQPFFRIYLQSQRLPVTNSA